MASGPAYTPIQTTTTEEGAEWRGGLPTSGFKHLQRMSILLFALSVVNLGLQAYVPTAMTSSGDYSVDNIASNAPWAAGVTFCTSLYMVWLATCALRGIKNSKVHIAPASCSLPKLHTVKECRSHLNATIGKDIEKVPGPHAGAQRNLLHAITAQLGDMDDIPPKVRVRVSCDGARMSRKSNFVIVTYSLLDIEQYSSPKGNHVIAVVNGPESYATLETSLKDVWFQVSKLAADKKVVVKGKEVAVETILGGDLKLVFGCIGMSLTFGILHGGVVVSSSTASNLQSVQSDPSHICRYFNNTETTAQPPVTLPFGCFDCNPSYSGSNVRPNMCCCCYRDLFSLTGQTTIKFNGVNNCHDIFTYVYPMSMTSAIIYGVSMLLSAIMFVTMCIVGCCQCYACSSFCGPFPPNGGVCMRTSGTRTFTANAQQTAPVYTVTPTMAYPVSAPAAAAGTPAGSSTAGPYQYGGTCEAQNPAAAARLGATAPPSYTDTIATKA